MTDFSDDDALAGEYVIGTLDDGERHTAEERRRTDPGFEQLIDTWSERLAPLLECIPTAEPSGRVLQAIMAQLGRQIPRAEAAIGSNVIQLRRQVRIWRSVASAAAAIAALLGIWIAAVPRPAAPGSSYMAVLQEGGKGPAFLVSLDLRNRRMTIMPSSVEARPDKSLELWLIGSDQSGPQSLGLLDATVPVRASLPELRPELISTATYAVTLEPKGGSPNGKPTAAPLYVGHLVEEPK